MNHNSVTMDAPADAPVNLRSTAGIPPFDLFEQWRSKGNIVRDEGMRSWIVLGYETCQRIEMDEDLFPNAYWLGNPELVEIKGGQNISSMQGAYHHRMRHFHLKLLSPVAVKSFRNDYIQPVLEYLFDTF